MFVPLPLLEKCIGTTVTVVLRSNEEIVGVLKYIDDEGKFNIVVSDAEVRLLRTEALLDAASADQGNAHANRNNGFTFGSGAGPATERFETSVVRRAQHVLVNGSDVAFIVPGGVKQQQQA